MDKYYEMIAHMDNKLNNRFAAPYNDEQFYNEPFVLVFYGKAILIDNNADSFDQIRQMLATLSRFEAE